MSPANPPPSHAAPSPTVRAAERQSDAFPGTLRLLVVGEADLLRDCVVAMLDRQVDLEVVGTAASQADAQGALAADRPDVVVLHVRAEEPRGIELLRRLREPDDEIRVLVLGDEGSAETLQRAFGAGASGYLCLHIRTEEILDAVRRTAAGETVVCPRLVRELAVAAAAAPPGAAELSDREHEVLAHISRGATNAEVAGELDISIRTVQKHLENLFRELGVHDREALVAGAFRQGLLS